MEQFQAGGTCRFGGCVPVEVADVLVRAFLPERSAAVLAGSA